MSSADCVERKSNKRHCFLPTAMALLSFEMQSLQWQRESSRAPNEGEAPGKWWKSYLLLVGAFANAIAQY